MEPIRFALTPEQKGMLASLLSETGEPVPTLVAAIAEALEELQEHERFHHANGGTNGSEEPAGVSALPPRKKRLGEIAEELFRDIPEEELARFPVDGAAQHDHYIYGLPKRPS